MRLLSMLLLLLCASLLAAPGASSAALAPEPPASFASVRFRTSEWTAPVDPASLLAVSLVPGLRGTSMASFGELVEESALHAAQPRAGTPVLPGAHRVDVYALLRSALPLGGEASALFSHSFEDDVGPLEPRVVAFLWLALGAAALRLCWPVRRRKDPVRPRLR